MTDRLVILFPANPMELSRPDPAFADEVEAAKQVGFEVHLIDHDERSEPQSNKSRNPVQKKSRKSMPKIFEAHHIVRSYECDLYGHVNNAVYLNFLEWGRFKLVRDLGYDLNTFQDSGVLIVIRRIEIDYRFSAEMGDDLVIRSRLVKLRKTSGVFHQEIYRTSDEKLVVSALVTWVFINRDGRPIAIPEDFRTACERELHEE